MPSDEPTKRDPAFQEALEYADRQVDRGFCPRCGAALQFSDAGCQCSKCPWNKRRGVRLSQ